MSSMVQCVKCGYVWVARKVNPKACPLCKRYVVYGEVKHGEV